MLRPGPLPDDAALAAHWAPDGRAEWFSRAAWALGAVVAAHGNDRPARLFLPDYFCNQSTGPARDAAGALVFYPVAESLAPDWDACAALARDAPPDLFLQVHYFGFPADLAPARAFCDAHGAALIEDAAHALIPSSGVGGRGDYVLWSLYKHLPVPDGGLLVVRPTARARPDRVAAAADRLRRAAPKACGWVARRLIQSAAPALARRLRGPAAENLADDPPTLPLPPTAMLSMPARRLLAHQAPALDAIAARRRDNERALRQVLAGSDLAPVLPPADTNWTPYRAVFRAPTADAAAAHYRRIQARGLPVETWPDLAPGVRAAPGRHAAALALRNSVLCLPVNADLSPAALTAAYGEP